MTETNKQEEAKKKKKTGKTYGDPVVVIQ